MIVSNLTEASNDAPAVSEVETSWNPPSDHDMANDTDECHASIDEEEDIVQAEHMHNDIPSGKVASVRL